MTAPADKLGLYLHIPFCVRKCPYCAFYSEPVDGYCPSRLVRALRTEIDLYDITEPVETIYIGGGSPSCLPGEVLVGLVRSLTERFGAVDEFTVECNPAQVNEAALAQLRIEGVNRLSIGAQSFDDSELKTLGRLHDAAAVGGAVAAARRAGFDNIGLDLMFGVPHSSLLSWQANLDAAMALEVQHLSAYSLTIEAGTPFETRWRSGSPGAIDEPRERAMYELARVCLKEAGFEQYEISNFARGGFQCRHNRRYWQNWPVIGVGPSASGWYRGKRTANIANITGYMEVIEGGEFFYRQRQTPTPEQMAAETAVLNLRMLEGIDLAAYQRQTGFDLYHLFPQAIERHCDLGLLIETGTHLHLSEIGLSLADTVAADFSMPD